MGEDGYFRREVAKLMKSNPASSVRDSFNTLKQEEMSPSISDVDTIHNKIDDIMNRAKARAELQLPDLMEEIRIQGATRAAQRQAARGGNIESAKQFINQVNY
jgi:hypothetical protein